MHLGDTWSALGRWQRRHPSGLGCLLERSMWADVVLADSDSELDVWFFSIVQPHDVCCIVLLFVVFTLGVGVLSSSILVLGIGQSE